VDSQPAEWSWFVRETTLSGARHNIRAFARSGPTRLLLVRRRQYDVACPRARSAIAVERNIAFTLLSVAIVFLLLQFMQTVLIPFVVAGLLFYALDAASIGFRQREFHAPLEPARCCSSWFAGTGTLPYSLQGQALT
jgi:hypothetical protein